MSEKPFWKLAVGYGIPLLVLIILGIAIYGTSGLLTRTKAGVNATQKYITFGAEQARAEEVVILAEHKEAIESMVSTMQAMLKSPKVNCFAQYGTQKIGTGTSEKNGLPNLGEQETTITLSQEMILVGKGVPGREQFARSFSSNLSKRLAGFESCVIAGPQFVAENFDESFLNDKPQNEKIIHIDHFYPVGKITIFYENPGVKPKGNVIRVAEFGDVVNDEQDNLEDNGILYKPDATHICFFPTVYGDVTGFCDGSSGDGLDNDCLLDETEDISLPRQMKEGKLRLCSGTVAQESLQPPTLAYAETETLRPGVAGTKILD